MRSASSTSLHGQQRERGQRRVARPDQMVAAQCVGAVAPGRAHAGDQSTRKHPVLMRLEHRRRHQRFLGKPLLRRRQRELSAPILPPLEERLPDRRITLGKRRPRQRMRASAQRGEAQGDHALPLDQRRRQGDVAPLGARETVGEAAIAREILPAVRRADIAHAQVGHRHVRGHAQRADLDGRVGRAILDPGIVVVAVGAQVRRRDDSEPVGPLQVEMHKHDIA